jgi:exosortase
VPLLYQLSQQWSGFEQYNYGWAVPVLCLYLLWQRWVDRPGPAKPRRKTFAVVLLAVLLLAFLPVRLVHGANPMWRVTCWAWALIFVFGTLVCLWLAGGWPWVRCFGPSVGFFLVAVPWPSPVEASVGQGLMSANAGATVEILGILGIPALQRGNLIELGTGLVGVEEACSGIRSLQATPMFTLFFALRYHLGLKRGFLLVLAGSVLTLLFNLVRTTLLSSISARHGPAAIQVWHDSVGVFLPLMCFLSVWGVARLLEGRRVAPGSTRESHKADPGLEPAHLPLWAGWALLAWALCCEAGTEAWYRSRESALPAAVAWSISLPKESQDFTDQPMAEKTRRLLRCDAAVSATWKDSDQNRWQAFYIRWNPGRTALHFAQQHTPDICLPSAGWRTEPLPGIYEMGPLEPPLRFRCYRVHQQDGPGGYVFYCRSGDRRDVETEEQFESPRLRRLRSVLSGRGRQGMSVLEIVVIGVIDESAAEAAVREQLREMIRPGES